MSSYQEIYFQLPSKCFSGKHIEAQFTTRFWKNIKKWNGHFWKISDLDFRKKPYDAIMVFNWIDAKIEFKQSSNKKTVNLFKLLLPHQILWLEEVLLNWWLPLVIYYNTFHNKYYVKKYSRDLDSNLVII